MSPFLDLLLVVAARDAVAAWMVVRGHLTVTARRKPKPRRTETQA